MQRKIAQFLRHLQVERAASPHTLKGYREDLEAFAEYFQDEGAPPPEPGSITAPELRGFLSALHEAGYAKTSIARKLASLRSFYRYGMREGWAESNPARALRNPRKARKLPHFLTDEQISTLLEAPDNSTAMGLRDRAILEVLYSAGLRVSELVGLSDGDVDTEQGLVLVRGKGRRERLAPLGSFALKALDVWWAKRKLHPEEPAGRAAPVFVNRFRKRLTTRSIPNLRFRPDAGKVSQADRPRPPHEPAHAAAQFRHAPLGPRGGRAQRAGTAGPQEPGDHADLHARQHGEPAEGL